MPDMASAALHGPVLDDVRITVFADLPDAETAWRAMEAAGRCHVFQCFDWVAAWQARAGSEERVRPCPVAVRSDRLGDLLFLPLGIERRGRARLLVWLGGTLADYRGPILGPGFAAAVGSLSFPALWRSIQDRLPPHDAVWFEKQPAAIDGMENPFLGLGGRPMPYSAHMIARLPGDWPTLYADRTSPRTRQAHRRSERAVERRGAAVFTPSVPPDGADVGVRRLLEMKSSRLARQGQPDLLSTNGTKAFLTALTTARGLTFSAHLSTLQVGGTVEAAAWGVVHRERYYFLVTAFDEGLATAGSPGSMLLHRLLGWACGHRLRSFDLTIGDEDYKRRWADTTMEIRIHAEGRTLRGRALVAAWAAAEGARRLVRRSPVLSRLVPPARRIRAALTAARR